MPEAAVEPVDDVADGDAARVADFDCPLVGEHAGCDAEERHGWACCVLGEDVRREAGVRVPRGAGEARCRGREADVPVEERVDVV